MPLFSLPRKPSLYKADRIVSFILPGLLLSLDTRSERHAKGGTIRGRYGYLVQGDHLFCYGRSGENDFEGGPSTARQVSKCITSLE